MAAWSLPTRSRRMRARSSVHTGLVMPATLLSGRARVALRSLQVHGDARDEAAGGIEHDRLARFEASVAIVDGLSQLDRHDTGLDAHSIDVELIAVKRFDRFREECHVRVASGVRVPVGT